MATKPGDEHVLVVGASGFVGSAAIARLAAEGRNVIGLSRRIPGDAIKGVTYISCDLLDEQLCHNAAQQLGHVTHCIYAAVNETPGDLVASWSDPDHAARNGRMFSNLLDALTGRENALRHVVLVHGTKAYGVLQGDRKIVPLRESLPRPGHDDFYFRQEDYLWSRAMELNLAWTVIRAQIIVGGGSGSNLNGLLALCVFAALRRALGLDFPLVEGDAPDFVLEMTDVELLAKALSWTLGADTAHNQIFNVTNGDVFTWRDLWPVIAREIGLPVGPPAVFSVRSEIDRNKQVWAELVRSRHLDLPDDPLAYLGESAALADFATHPDRNVVTSSVKIRQAGFHEFIDTADSVARWIRRWRSEGLLP